MSARTHPRLVGVFVLGAVGLVLAAIAVLSSGGWLQPRDRFAVFLPGSVSGLNPGSPVTFRGVRMGQVVEVSPLLTGNLENPIQIEVVIEFAGEVVEVPPGMADPFADLSTEELGKLLVKRGVRGRLVSQSLLTGQKAIDFDFLPDQPARFAGVNPRYFELPTTPTPFERLSARFDQLSAKLADLPLDEMLEDARKAIQSAREVLESEDVKQVFASGRRAADGVEATLSETRKTLQQAQTLMSRLDTEVESLGGESRSTLAEVRERLQDAERTLESLDASLRGADDARVEASQTLAELSRTLRALRNLVDYVQTHPEAVIQGKEPRKENR